MAVSNEYIPVNNKTFSNRTGKQDEFASKLLP